MADGFDAFSEEVEAPKVSTVANAERAVIACVLCDDQRTYRAVERAAAMLSPGDFSNDHNGTVWAAILAVNGRGEVVDVPSIAEELASAIDRGAQRALIEASGLLVSPSTIEQHARRVAEHAYRRAVKAKLREAYQRVDAPGLPLDAVTAAHEVLASMPTGPRTRSDDGMHASVLATFARIEARFDAMAKGCRATARWGVAALDGYTDENGGFFEGAVGGLFPGKLYVLAGVPASGKTTLAWQATISTATGDETTPRKRVLVFSLEMSREDICQRLAAQACGISESRIENGAISSAELNALGRYLTEKLSTLPINIITDCRTIEEMRARVLAEMAVGTVGLVVIDFLQRTKVGRRIDDQNRADQERVYEAKGIANEGVPVLAVSSMSKAAQGRAAEGNVGMADTSGSGTEYAADLIAFLIRTDPKDQSGCPEVRFEVAKRRGGPPSSATLRFDMTRGRFETVVRRIDGSRPDSLDMPEGER